jgi:hypothetical protein
MVIHVHLFVLDLAWATIELLSALLFSIFRMEFSDLDGGNGYLEE